MLEKLMGKSSFRQISEALSKLPGQRNKSDVSLVSLGAVCGVDEAVLGV
jgi:hypothetical protein